ncbi:hypothetical protein BN1708_017543, partial [Verticillium longisporum]
APPESPPSIDNGEHIESSTEIVLKDLAHSGELEKYDGVLVACYSVHTLVDRLSRQYGDRLAVTGIFEASILTATALLPQTIVGAPPSQWGIVTTGSFWEKHLADGVTGYLGQIGGGGNTKFKGVVSSGLTAGDFHHVSPEEVKAKLEEATRKLLGDGGVSCIAMGCGGMAGLEDIIRSNMAFTYVPGTFDFWAARQSTHLVDMHETAFVPFNVHQAVGTAGLGSCSVVAIASERAVILAHIPPLPDLHSQRPDAGDANVRQMMKRVRRLYRDNRQFFDNAEGRVTCAIYAGEVALPDQVAIMQEQLRLLGFEPSTDYYQVPADANVGRGTVVIVAPPH